MNVFTMLYKIVNLHSVYSLSHLGDYVYRGYLVLPDFLLGKHLLHIHRCFDDAWTGLDTERYSGT